MSTPTPVNATGTGQAPLAPGDRCDRCGAQAYVRAVLPGGGELLFCAHHSRAHADALREAGVALQDDTGVLAALSQSDN